MVYGTRLESERTLKSAAGSNPVPTANFMSHGPRSYLKIRKGLQGKTLGHGCWYNGFVKPANKFNKRRAARRVRRNKDVSDGNEYKKLWGYWEWC